MVTEITSRIIPLHGCAISMKGGRQENQDDWGFIDTPVGFLLVVCDGMGGGPGGKTASYIAKNELMAALMRCTPQTSRMEAFKLAISTANDALFRKMDETPQLRGMGSTLVAILITDDSVISAHLGDSRCYRVGRGRVLFRTTDHSLVGELVQNKAMTEEQARLSPQSNVIMRALGQTQNHVPEISELPYKKGDRFILCTDGVWGVMPHEQLTKRLTTLQTVDALASNLSAEIERIGFSADGHHDNHTLAVVEMDADSILKETMSKQLKIFISVITVLMVVSLIFNLVAVRKLNKLSQIEVLQKEIEKLKEDNQSLSISQDVKDDNTKALITKVEVLQYEKDCLEENQVKLINRIDSLEKVIAKRTSKPVLQPSSKEIAQRVLNLFASLDEVQGEDAKKTIKMKVEYKQKIKEELLVLDKKTSGKYALIISGINRQLNGDLVTSVMLKSEKKKVYVTSNAAKKEIDKLASKVRTIMKNL